MKKKPYLCTSKEKETVLTLQNSKTMTINKICNLLQEHGLFFGLVCQPWLKYDTVSSWYLKDADEVDRLTEDKRLKYVYLRVELTEDEYMEVIDGWENYDEEEEIIVSYHHMLEWYILIG